MTRSKPRRSGYSRKAYRDYELGIVKLFVNSPTEWAHKKKPTAKELADFLGRSKGSLCGMQDIVRKRIGEE